MAKETLGDIKKQIEEANRVVEFDPTFDPQFKQSDGNIFVEPEAPAPEPVVKVETDKKEEQDWKLLYGRSENEKGGLRKELEEARRQAREFESRAYAPPPQQTQAQNIDFFMNLQDDDFYDPKKVRRAMNDALIMLGSAAQAQIEAVKYRASIKDWADNVTPDEEREIRMESSRFINQMTPDAQEAYIYEKAKMKRTLRDKPELDKAKEQQAKLSQMTAERAFVESSSETSREEPTSALDALWAKFDSGELNSEQMKKELKRHNLYKVDQLRRRV